MARPAPQSRARQDAALQLLKADHEEVKVLIDEFADTDEPREREIVARRLGGLLTVHARIEEELFYPALRDAVDPDDRPLLDQAAVEHESARDLIAKLDDPQAGDERRAALVKVLGEYVKHHVDEEEDDLFPRARAARLDQVALAAALLERKQALMSELGLDDDDEDDDEAEDDDDLDDEDEAEDEDWDEDDEDDGEGDLDDDVDEELDEDDDDADEDEDTDDEDADSDEDEDDDSPAPRRRSGR